MSQGWAQPASPPLPVSPAPNSQLAERERALSNQMRELEATFLRLADLLDTTDPRRAATLRSAFEQARELEVTNRLDTIVELLEKGQLLKASTGQDAAIDRLRELLAVLESGENRKTVTDSKKKVKEFLGRINNLIARQMGLEGTTEAGGNPDEIAKKQNILENDTQTLAEDVDVFRRESANAAGKKPQGDSDDKPASATDGPSKDGPSNESSEGQGGENGNSPNQGSDSGEKESSEQEPQGNDEVSRADRTNRRLETARSRMKEARDKLDAVEPHSVRKRLSVF